MNYKQLQNGDVLLFEYRRNATFYARGIRFFTGSRFIHCGIVIDEMILEQMQERMHSQLKYYYPFVGETIHCVRPKFEIGVFDPNLFRREGYGYLAIGDCLLNHLLKRITFGKWEYKPILVKVFSYQKIDCGTLNAIALKLDKNTNWCKYVEVVEPDDFFNHDESFEYLGTIDGWEL